MFRMYSALVNLRLISLLELLTFIVEVFCAMFPKYAVEGVLVEKK